MIMNYEYKEKLWYCRIRNKQKVYLGFAPDRKEAMLYALELARKHWF